MGSLGESLWRLVPAVRETERSRALFFATLLSLISAAQTMGLAGSEALLLSGLGTEQLPQIFIAASIATVLGSMLYGARVGAARNDRLLIQMLIASAVFLLLAAFAVQRGVDAALAVLFCFFYLTQAIFLNHFWTFSGDFFDALSSKRLFPVFTVGSSVGGLAGGLAAMGLTGVAGPVSLVVGWAVLLALAALLLRLARRPLRRWGPLELEEADETSVEGMRGAARYLGRAAIGRWLVLSALGMVLALFIAQYLYSQIFLDAFPDPTELAAFFGLYLAVTNLIEIALELAVTPWLIHRFGVPIAQLVHPALTLASFGGLAWHQGLATGISARVSRELVENAIAQPIRSLVYNALPQRLRGRIRAFLEGIVVYGGMSAAGILLLVLGDPDPRMLAAVGAMASLLYFAANWRVRGAYLHELVDGIRAGRLDFGALGDEVGDLETSRLADLCEQLMREETGHPSRSLLRLLPSLARHGIAEPLVHGTEHPHPKVRQACIAELASLEDERAPGLLERGLRDTDARVRLAALEGLARVRSGAPLAAALTPLLRDPDALIRAGAAVHCRADGVAVLREMLAASDPRSVTAALAVAPPSLAEEVARHAEDPNTDVRARSLERARELGPPAIPDEAIVREALTADAPAVRCAAVGLFAHLRPRELEPVASALADPAAIVRAAAIEALSAAGDSGVHAAAPYLRDGREPAVEAALRVTVAAATPVRRGQALRDELRHRVRHLWYCLLDHQDLPRHDGTALVFLKAAYADAMLRHRRLAFRTLALLENERIIRKVDRALRSGAQRVRSDALEVLSNLGDRESAQLLVLVHETAPLRERQNAALPLLPTSRVAAERDPSRSESRWIRAAAAAQSGDVGENGVGIQVMERLLALKQVPLFANLTLDQLEAIHQLAKEVLFLPGEVIMREGDPGDELYVLLEGAADVYLGWETPAQSRLGEVRAVDYVGEMAILDDEPRSASIVAAEQTRALSFEGDSLKDLILQMPEISFEIFRVLTRRVRTAERRLRES